MINQKPICLRRISVERHIIAMTAGACLLIGASRQLTAQEAHTYDSLLEADRTVSLTTRIAGIIQAVMVREGAHVEQGDTLLALEDHDVQAQYRQALARFENARQTYAWDDELLRQDAISERAHLDSKTRLVDAQTALEQALLAVQRTRILAPFTGVVVEPEQPLAAGQLAPPNTPVCTLVNFHPLKATIYIPEARIRDIHIGSPATIQSRHQHQLHARAVVVDKSPVINPASGTVKLKLAIQGEVRGMIPGMQVIVSFAPPSP